MKECTHCGMELPDGLVQCECGSRDLRKIAAGDSRPAGDSGAGRLLFRDYVLTFCQILLWLYVALGFLFAVRFALVSRPTSTIPLLSWFLSAPFALGMAYAFQG